jgi:hypothetical protein
MYINKSMMEKYMLDKDLLYSVLSDRTSHHTNSLLADNIAGM